jgi:predicted ATP-dependent endonuclease of OLD family
MIIDSIKVENFASIQNETLNVDDLTILVGANGAGKSSFLKAINIFYDKYAPQKDDFYNNDTNKEILVSITYRNLTAEAIKLFDKYIESGKLTVEKVIRFDPATGKLTATYHGSKLQNPDFDIIRNQTKAGDQKTAFENLKTTNTTYASLGKWIKQEEGQKILKEWEEQNQSKCIRQRDDGRFFGFTSVGQGYLGRFTKILHLPAVLDADDISNDIKGSIIVDLM